MKGKIPKLLTTWKRLAKPRYTKYRYIGTHASKHQCKISFSLQLPHHLPINVIQISNFIMNGHSLNTSGDAGFEYQVYPTRKMAAYRAPSLLQPHKA
jgi:hypothetical protein